MLQADERNGKSVTEQILQNTQKSDRDIQGDTKYTQTMNISVGATLYTKVLHKPVLLAIPRTSQCHWASLSSNVKTEADQVRRKMIEKIIRVDHAGEMGASYIYQGTQ